MMNFLIPVATLGGLAVFVGLILTLVSRLLKVEKEFTVRVTNDGNEFTVGWNANLAEALKAAGYGIMTSCGGQGVCGTCRVRIIEGLDEPSPAQVGPLKGKLRKEGWVLSCQVQVQNDLVIELFAPLVSSWPAVAKARAEAETEAKAETKAKAETEAKAGAGAEVKAGGEGEGEGPGAPPDQPKSKPESEPKPKSG